MIFSYKFLLNKTNTINSKAYFKGEKKLALCGSYEGYSCCPGNSCSNGLSCFKKSTYQSKSICVSSRTQIIPGQYYPGTEGYPCKIGYHSYNNSYYSYCSDGSTCVNLLKTRNKITGVQPLLSNLNNNYYLNDPFSKNNNFGGICIKTRCGDENEEACSDDNIFSCNNNRLYDLVYMPGKILSKGDSINTIKEGEYLGCKSANGIPGSNFKVFANFIDKNNKKFSENFGYIYLTKNDIYRIELRANVYVLDKNKRYKWNLSCTGDNRDVTNLNYEYEYNSTDRIYQVDNPCVFEGKMNGLDRINVQLTVTPYQGKNLISAYPEKVLKYSVAIKMLDPTPSNKR